MTNETIKNIRNAIESFVNENIENPCITNVYSNDDDPDYTYISIFDNDKSIDENFEKVDKLNYLVVEHDLKYIFVVG